MATKRRIMVKPDMKQDYERLVQIMGFAEFYIKDNRISGTDAPTCSIEELAAFMVKRGVTVGVKYEETPSKKK